MLSYSFSLGLGMQTLIKAGNQTTNIHEKQYPQNNDSTVAALTFTKYDTYVLQHLRTCIFILT